MATVTLKRNATQTSGELPKTGSRAPDFQLVRQDLSEAALDTYSGKSKLLNIFVSADTDVCAESIRKFYEQCAEKENLVVLNISMDLPFAAKRFCESKGLKNVETLSAFRSDFGDQYGVTITDGPLKGLYARAVILLDKDNTVLYEELVPEITHEPNYQAVLDYAKS